MLLLRLFQALIEKQLEFSARVFGLSAQFVQEFAFFVVKIAVSKERLPQPGSALSAEPR